MDTQKPLGSEVKVGLIEDLKIPAIVMASLLFSIACCCGTCSDFSDSDDKVDTLNSELVDNKVKTENELDVEVSSVPVKKVIQEDIKNRSFEAMDASKSNEVVESLLDLWSTDVENDGIYFLYLDFFNEYRNCGEIEIESWYEYKIKNGGVSEVHDSNRKELGKEFGCVAEAITDDTDNAKVLNNFYWYKAKNGKIVESLTLEDVNDKYENEFKDKLDSVFLNMLVSKNSKFTKKLVSLRVADNFKKIVIGKGATESNYNSKAVSEKGAEGVFQIMPADRKYLESEVKDQDYFKLDQFSKDLFLLISHYSDQYDYIYSKLSDEDKKRFDELANDRDLFENVLIPILVTGYNQGKGRSSRLFKLLVDMHDNNDILENGKI